MLHKSFKPAKCKTSLKLAMARIKLLRNKREVQVKQMRRELAQLLESGQEQTARIRVEHVIREEKTMSAYELIELYCELIVARLPIIESQKSCPIDLKEAVSSVIFVSPRCADIPELMDIRKNFSAKYGKEFINSALEVRPDCGVSRMVVEKLSARAPDIETKIKTLTAIAQEHNVQWDSQTFEEQLKKPHDDLLNGPTSFAGASKIPTESSNVKPSPAPQTNKIPTESSNVKPSPAPQTNESSMKMPQNDTASRPTISTSFPETNTRTSTSLPFTLQSESRPSESIFQGGEVNNSYSREENASLNQPTWNMEFQDATSAAQAAAEAAERAGMAARAAAELASRGNMSRQNSTGSHESPTYITKYERPEKLRVFLDEHTADKSPKGNNEIKSSQGMKTEVHHLQEDERMHGISRREAAKTSSNDYSTDRRQPSRSSSRSSQGFVNDDILDINLPKDDLKDYSHVQRISSESETMGPDHLNMKYELSASSQEGINSNNRKAASSHFVSDDEKFWNSNIYKHGNDEGETFRMDAGEVSFGSNHKQSTSGDSFAVVFDNYDSDGADNNSVFGRNGRNLLDPHHGEDSSSFQSDKGLFGMKQNISGSFAKKSGPKLHLFTESVPEEHAETMTKGTFPSQPAFDVSDEENTESEDEVIKSAHKEAMRPGNFLNDHRPSTRGSFSDESTYKVNHSYMGESKEVEETIQNFGFSEEKIEINSNVADKFYERSGSGSLPDSQLHPRSEKAPSKSGVSVGGPDYSSSDGEEPQPLRLTKRQYSRETEAKEKSRMPSTQLDTKSEVSNESGQGINFGRLTGGFKHRGFPRPPYVRSSAADVLHSSKQTSDSTSIAEKAIASDLDKQSASFEVANQERYNQQSCAEAFASNSRTSGASVDSYSDPAEKLAARYTAEDSTGMYEREFDSHKAKIAEDVDVPAQESYYPRSRRNDYKEGSSNFREEYDDPVSNEQTRFYMDTRQYRDSASVPQKQRSYASVPNKTYASSEAVNREKYDQKPQMKANKESNSRMAHLDPDASEAKSDSIYNSGSRVKLSRRTRDVPSEPKSSSSGVTEPLPRKTYDAVTIQRKTSSEPVQTNLPAQQPSIESKQMSSTFEESPNSQMSSTGNLVPTNDGSTKSSSSTGESVSRESSLKKASHTHPKLPDYESLAAHFHSLRSNRR